MAALPPALRLGLLSDTHGLLRPQVLEALRGCELILHAGDIGAAEVLDQLKGIAPVIAVRGNVDTQRWCYELPSTEIVELPAASIYVLHNLSELGLNPAASGFHIVLSGHTHKHEARWKDNVLYINPGSAGPRRFSLPITLATLDLSQKPWSPRFIELRS